MSGAFGCRQGPWDPGALDIAHSRHGGAQRPFGPAAHLLPRQSIERDRRSIWLWVHIAVTGVIAICTLSDSAPLSLFPRACPRLLHALPFSFMVVYTPAGVLPAFRARNPSQLASSASDSLPFFLTGTATRSFEPQPEGAERATELKNRPLAEQDGVLRGLTASGLLIVIRALSARHQAALNKSFREKSGHDALPSLDASDAEGASHRAPVPYCPWGRLLLGEGGSESRS